MENEFVENFEYKGIMFSCAFPEDDVVRKNVHIHGNWEPWLLDFVDKHLAVKGRLNTIVDVGANVGLSSIYIAKRMPDARVVALEPSEKNFATLNRNIQMANVSNIKSLQLAVSDKNGQLQFIGHGAHAHIQEANSDSVEVREVASVSLDVLLPLEGVNEVELLKVDVEGFENEVLLGCEYYLDKFLIRYLIMEVSLMDIVNNRGPRDLGRILDERMSLLRAAFRHLYLMMRDGTLILVQSLTHLRILLHTDFPVGDLVVSNEILLGVDSSATRFLPDVPFSGWEPLNMPWGCRGWIVKELDCCATRRIVIEVEFLEFKNSGSFWVYLGDEVFEFHGEKLSLTNQRTELKNVSQIIAYFETSLSPLEIPSSPCVRLTIDCKLCGGQQFEI